MEQITLNVCLASPIAKTQTFVAPEIGILLFNRAQVLFGNRDRIERYNVSRPAPSLNTEFVSQAPPELRMVFGCRKHAAQQQKIARSNRPHVGTDWCGRGWKLDLSSCQDCSASKPDRSPVTICPRVRHRLRGALPQLLDEHQ